MTGDHGMTPVVDVGMFASATCQQTKEVDIGEDPMG
jgi:hypothetical protein